MVRLTQVHDEVAGDSEYEYETDYDATSDAESEISVADESLLERLAALKDIIPPEARYQLSSRASQLASFGQSLARFLGKSAWVLSTSAIVMLAPLVFEIEKETQVILFEKEQAMREQTAQQMIGSGPSGSSPAGTPAVGGANKTIVPPGF